MKLTRRKFITEAGRMGLVVSLAGYVSSLNSCKGTLTSLNPFNGYDLLARFTPTSSTSCDLEAKLQGGGTVRVPVFSESGGFIRIGSASEYLAVSENTISNLPPFPPGATYNIIPKDYFFGSNGGILEVYQIREIEFDLIGGTTETYNVFTAQPTPLPTADILKSRFYFMNMASDQDEIVELDKSIAGQISASGVVHMYDGLQTVPYSFTFNLDPNLVGFRGFKMDQNQSAPNPGTIASERDVLAFIYKNAQLLLDPNLTIAGLEQNRGSMLEPQVFQPHPNDGLGNYISLHEIQVVIASPAVLARIEFEVIGGNLEFRFPDPLLNVRQESGYTIGFYDPGEKVMAAVGPNKSTALYLHNSV